MKEQLNITMIKESVLEWIIDELKAIREKVEALEFDGIKARWLTNDEVLKLLKVSKRTLQTYRDRRVIGFSQFGAKIYYKAEDIEQFLSDKYTQKRI